MSSFGSRAGTLLLLVSSLAVAQEALPTERVSLDDAVHRALQHNPNSRAAVQQVKLAYAQMEEVRSFAFPALTANATFTRLDHDRTITTSPGNPPQVIVPKNQLGGNLQLVLPLLQPTAWANWSRAVDLVDVTRMSFADTQRLVALATARAYLTAYAEHLVVDAETQARENARAHLKFAQKRLQGGVGNRIDAVRAAQELASDEAQLQAALAQLARARGALGVLMGIDGATVDVAEGSAQGQLPPAPALSVALKGGHEKRTDVKVGEERIRATDHSLNMTYTEYLPTLALVAQVFAQDYASFSTPSAGWQAQVLLSVPLYDGSLRYGHAHEREASLSIARLTQENTVRQAESDVRAAFEAFNRAQTGLVSAREATQLAHEALSLADLAYRAGATNELDVIDAERRARDADTSTASAEDTALQAQLDLLNVSGYFP